MKFIQIVLFGVFMYASTQAAYIKQNTVEDINNVALALETGAEGPTRRFVAIDKIGNWFKNTFGGKQESSESVLRSAFTNGKNGKSLVLTLNSEDVAKKVNKFINSKKFRDLSQKVATNFAVSFRAMKEELQA